MQLRNNGISLIEVILTVSLILIAGGALVRLGVTALNTSDASRMRGIALQKATEALELARTVRDNDATGFFNLTGNFKMDFTGSVDTAATVFITSSCNPLSFTAHNSCKETITIGGSAVDIYRVVSITGAGTNRKQVTAYVYWNARGEFSNASSSTVLTKWRI